MRVDLVTIRKELICMYRSVLGKFFATLCLTAMVLLGTTSIASANSFQTQAKPPPRFGKISEKCGHLLVKLHGNDAPDVQCLDQQT